MYICKNKIDIIIYTYLFRYGMYVWGSEELFVNAYKALDTARLSIGYFTFVQLADFIIRIDSTRAIAHSAARRDWQVSMAKVIAKVQSIVLYVSIYNYAFFDWYVVSTCFIFDWGTS